MPAPAAERFDDIIVAPQVMHMGETHHGYQEFRVLVENQSNRRSHQVTLVFPENHYSYGHAIRRVQRTVSVGPGSRTVVPFWQPPLPAHGNGRLGVSIDGRSAGAVTVPNPNRHAQRHHSHHQGQGPITVLASRGINHDEFLQTVQGKLFSALLATGEPDFATRRGNPAESVWMPNPSKPGPHWIELDFETPATIDRIRIHEGSSSASGEIILLSQTGSELFRFPKTAPETSFTLTAEPVKTVRIEFPGGRGTAPAIDAVKVFGPGGEMWASDARASSSRPAPAASRGGGSVFYNVIRAELASAEWSEQWLSYTPYDAVAFSSQEFESAPPPVRAALWRYVECGGTLFVFGNTGMPEPWRSMVRTEIPGGAKYGAGFGHALVFEGAGIPKLNESEAKQITSSIETAARFWRDLPRDSAANSNFPVTADTELPIRGIIFIMLGFIVLIGPANLIVLSKLKRRTWMLWTIPAISFLTCTTVFSYMLLREGVTPDVRLETVTVLDQVNHRASSFVLAAYYCPLTPNQGLSFSYHTEATPLVTIGDRSGSARDIDWTESQHLRRGWIEARVPAHFLLRKSETRRERLQIEGTPDQPEIVNGLGAHIHKLWLADASGRVFSAADIAPGRKVALEQASEQLQPRKERRSLHALLHQVSIGGHSKTLESDPMRYLVPGAYIAELDQSPFVERGLQAKSPRVQQQAWVYGILPPPQSP